MIRRHLIAPAALILGLAPLALVAPQPAYAAPVNFHIKNSVYSRNAANIYGESNCSASGSIHILQIGDSAQSTGWDGMRVWPYDFNITVYDGSTGAYITNREYQAGTCVKAYKSNDYLITVYNYA
jgi:hypothetical protein